MKTLRQLLVPLAALAVLAAPSALRATPYATSLTNNAGVISFRLNESGFVTIITTNLSGAFVTNNLGNRNQGLTVTNLGNPGNFTVIVAKTNTPGFASGAALQISVDGTNTVALATNTMRFNSPRGVAVNQNPASPLFGRIYVANSAAGTLAAPNPRSVGDGFYLLNADGTDAVGQGDTARTGGLPVGASTEFPGRLEVGPDGLVYVASGSGTFSNSYIMAPDALSGELAVTNSRGISSIIPSGSTNTGNLLLYSIDSDTPGDNSFLNHAKVVNVGSGPFPVSFGTNITEGGLLSIAGVIVDIARGPDGKIYAMQYRLVDADPNLLIFDPNVDGDADGLADLVYDSRGDTISQLGQSRDYLFGARAVAISPDGKYLAVLREDNAILVTPLVNGIPDIFQRKVVATSPTTTLARDIAFDAAGNIYTVSSGQGLMRIYSPGYTTIATTDTTGFFSVTNILPEPVVTITGTITNAAEPNTDGEFTFTRTGGDTTQPLTVFYTIGGTATRGVDWNTNSISATTNASLTFPANVTIVTVPIVVIDDSLGENTETVTFTLTAGTNYVSGVNLPATVWIADDGDLPSFTITNLGGTYELLSGRPGKFRVTLAGVVTSPLVVTGTLAGTAVAGTDYVGTPGWSVTFQPGVTSTNFTVTPIDNAVIASNKTIIATVVAGAGYVVGSPATATNILRNDDTAPLPILFADNFDTDTSASWAVRTNGGGNEALFAYDYSVDGVPVAPNTTNATTRGLRMRANIILAVSNIQGIAVSPIGQSFTGDYRLRFDLWMNYNGPLPAGGTGSSQFFTAGLGVSETRTNVPSASPSPLVGSSVLTAVTGDGGFAEATGDYIMITNGVRITATTNVYPAGARDNLNIYYSEFGELAAPAAQATLYLNQTGRSPIGSIAFAWHDVILEKRGSNYTWIIDGLPIASVVYEPATVGNNITLGHMDLTAGLSDVTAMNFSIVDNLRVESLAVTPPVITSITLINSGADVQIDFNGGTPVGTYTLEATGDLTLGFSPVAATLTDLGGGQFRFVRAVAGAQQFYRVSRTNP